MREYLSLCNHVSERKCNVDIYVGKPVLHFSRNSGDKGSTAFSPGENDNEASQKLQQAIRIVRFTIRTRDT